VETNANSSEEVSEEVQKIFKDRDLASFGFTIDDVFVLYGYEVTIAYSSNSSTAIRRGQIRALNDNDGVYAIDEFDIDENRFRKLEKIAEEARKLHAKYFAKEISIG
jgi:hypothetical protein